MKISKLIHTHYKTFFPKLTCSNDALQAPAYLSIKLNRSWFQANCSWLIIVITMNPATPLQFYRFITLTAFFTQALINYSVYKEWLIKNRVYMAMWYGTYDTVQRQCRTSLQFFHEERVSLDIATSQVGGKQRQYLTSHTRRNECSTSTYSLWATALVGSIVGTEWTMYII